MRVERCEYAGIYTALAHDRPGLAERGVRCRESVLAADSRERAFTVTSASPMQTHRHELRNQNRPGRWRTAVERKSNRHVERSCACRFARHPPNEEPSSAHSEVRSNELSDGRPRVHEAFAASTRSKDRKCRLDAASSVSIIPARPISRGRYRDCRDRTLRKRTERPQAGLLTQDIFTAAFPIECGLARNSGIKVQAKFSPLQRRVRVGISPTSLRRPAFISFAGTLPPVGNAATIAGE